jgi:DNA-binding MarR family transcriptional regulator
VEQRTLSAALEDSVGALLRRVYAHFTAGALDDDPQARDYVVLDTLADQDVESQQELAERLGINRTIMVGLVDHLESGGYVTRTRNPANRRSYVLSITGEGRAARDSMREAVAARDDRITAALTPAERRRLDELLSRLVPGPDPIRSTAYLVAQAHYRLRRLGDALLADAGLRTRHLGALAAIEASAPCAQQQLARQLDITEPAVAQKVDELVHLGLVVRGRDPHDRRRYALELTDLGRERIVAVRRSVERMQAEVLDALGADGERDLRGLLGRLLPDV